MNNDLPLYLSALFIATTLLTLFLFYRAYKPALNAKNGFILTAILVAFLILQGILAYQQFYIETIKSVPPPFVFLGFMPSIAALILTFRTSKGRAFLDRLPLEKLTWIHIIRIPVEIGLWALFLNQAIPEIMTFEGRNFDVLAGLSAPLMILLYFKRKSLSKQVMLIWNVVCLLLLFNIVLTALFSFPSQFQQLAFEQPNRGILLFPFIWLPSFMVPVVMFSHFASIRHLRKNP